MLKRITFSFAVCMLLVLASCQYKDFDDFAGTERVTVVADYSRSGVDSLPSVTRCIFYPLQGSPEPFVCDLMDTTYTDLPEGSYRVFAYNNDSEINRMRAYKYLDGSPVIFTDKADYRGIYKADSIDHTVYYDYPDSTYSYYGTTEVVDVSGYHRRDANTVKLSMGRVTRDIVITVTGMRHSEYVTGVRFGLDGIKREYSPNKEYTSSYVAVIADGAVCGGDTLRTSFPVFGVGYSGHILTVHIEGNGFHKVLRFDVSTAVNDQRFGNGTIRINVKTDYDAGDDAPQSNTFKVDVKDWSDEEIPVDL